MNHFDLLNQQTNEEIRKEQQKLHSWEINESEYDEKYNAIMDNFRLSLNNILTYWYH